MSNTLAAKRYANALFQIAKEENQIDRLETEIRTVKEVFETNGHPVLRPERCQCGTDPEQKKRQLFP